MAKVNHINVPVVGNRVYCYRKKEVVTLDFEVLGCQGCEYFSGSSNGRGVECYYEDNTTQRKIVHVVNPYKEELKHRKD